MTIDELKIKIRPDIEATFGSTMTSVMFTGAMVKIMSEGRGLSEPDRCKLFLNSLAKDNKFVGMLGAAGAQSKVSSWMRLVV